MVERVELATDPSALASERRRSAAGGRRCSSTISASRRRRFTCRTASKTTNATEEWLSSRAGRRVKILVPQRGDKRALVELATRNAELSYRTRFNEITAAHFEALETLRSVIGLPALPRRIECFDISTIQGSETVASMVVCEDGRMKKSEYRKFRVRGSDAGVRRVDDFAAMREVVQRRYRKVLEDGGPFPDLILIDGGKGQLTAAYEALAEIGLGESRGGGDREEGGATLHARPRGADRLAENDPGLLLIQRIRDEAHRFAVTFHRRARSMRDLRSALEDVPGIGPRRRRALLTAFGSLAGVRRATREELAAVVGAKGAGAVIDYFAQRQGDSNVSWYSDIPCCPSISIRS